MDYFCEVCLKKIKKRTNTNISNLNLIKSSLNVNILYYLIKILT